MLRFIKYNYFEIIVAAAFALPVTGFLFGVTVVFVDNSFSFWLIPFSLFTGFMYSFLNLVMLGVVPYEQVGLGDTSLWPLNIISFAAIVFFLIRKKRKKLPKIPKSNNQD